LDLLPIWSDLTNLPCRCTIFFLKNLCY
jgi:hypothetical protein